MSGGSGALVVGASRGLGLVIARELAARGFPVMATGRDEETLAAARERMREWGHQLHTRVADVRDAEAMRATARATEEALGPIGVCINVAGVIEVASSAHPLDPEGFRDAIDTMLWGPINTASAVVPGMRERGRGRFGVVTSIGGKVAAPHLLAYSAAKAGAVGFSEGLSLELAGTGVSCTTIIPGLMRTGSHVRARFSGDAKGEYAWFAPGASLPGLSVGADRAARRIVDAVLAGRSHVVLTPLAQVGMRAHGLAPGLVTTVMGQAGRLLPDGGRDEDVEGLTARRRLASRVVNTLTALGDRAARRNNETATPPRPDSEP